MSKGFSLHIGLNSIDPQHYGNDGQLKACEADALDMEAIAKSLGYDNVSVLLTANATIDNVVNEIKKAASSLEKGDIFFLTYSGHGGVIPDLQNDEADGFDETWCLYDGQLLDDELFSLWHYFKEDVRIVVLSDSCHSGTVTRAYFYGLDDLSNVDPVKNITYRFMPTAINNRTFEMNRDFYINKKKEMLSGEKELDKLKCSVKLISGCLDNQLSADGTFNGLFTATLLTVWRNGTFQGDYQKFHRKILSLMPPDQSPNYFDIGKSNPVFNNQKPFII